MEKIEKYKPAVTKNVLLFLAGFAWICGGIGLLFLAFSWLSLFAAGNLYLFVSMGAGSGLMIHHFGFLKIVDRNLKRILPMERKKCLFSFVSWKSYPIMGVMAVLGIVLRHSSIPREYLAVLYTGIGLAMILSSFRYMRYFVREFKKQTISS